MTAYVRVQSNPHRDKPWLVICSLCAGHDAATLLGIFAAINGAGVKGYARTWQAAQDYAHRHALAHEATRCTTCLHVPAEPLPERTNA